MKLKSILHSFAIVLVLLIAITSCNEKQKEYVIENKSLARTISIESGQLHTSALFNKISGKKLNPENKDEFQLRISKGTSMENGYVFLTSKDFKVTSVKEYTDNTTNGIAISLRNNDIEMSVIVHYELAKNDFYIRKFLEIKSEKPITLERVDIEVIELGDIYQPYKIKQITSQGVARWRPGLGQPLDTSKSATFWGVEFPAAYNYVENKIAYCGYQWGKEIQKNEAYTSYKSIVGVADDTVYL